MAPEVSNEILEYINKNVRKAFNIQDDEKIPEYKIGNVTNNELKGGINVEVEFPPNRLYDGNHLIKEEVIYHIHIPDNII